MSPKKRQRRKNTTHRPPTTGQPSSAPAQRPERTPLVLPDPPDRRLSALWALLALTWALGTPLALAHLLFTAMDMQEGALAAGDPNAPAPQELVQAVGEALVWLLVLALGVPAASALAAAALRRKIAAIGFATALLVSAVPLLWLMPPAELWDALRTHLSR